MSLEVSELDGGNGIAPGLDLVGMESTEVTGCDAVQWDSSSVDPAGVDLEFATSGEELNGLGDAVVSLLQGIGNIF